MKKLRIFFDYEGPYCKRGYESFMELAGDRSDIEVEWRPIESHPRPEDHPPHTDLACAAYYAAAELGADMKRFFAAMFQAVAIERRNVEKVEVLTGIVKGVVDADRFRALIESGKYAKQIEENNDLAYEKSGVWFVPAFRMEGRKLDARGGVGVSREELREFLG